MRTLHRFVMRVRCEADLAMRMHNVKRDKGYLAIQVRGMLTEYIHVRATHKFEYNEE